MCSVAFSYQANRIELIIEHFYELITFSLITNFMPIAAPDIKIKIKRCRAFWISINQTLEKGLTHMLYVKQNNRRLFAYKIVIQLARINIHRHFMFASGISRSRLCYTKK